MPPASPPSVALLGTGKMGAAIARRVAAAGFPLRLWNRTRARAEAVGVGTVVDTPAEAVQGAGIVLSILFDEASVLATYRQLQPEPGQVFCELSTAGPALPGVLATPLEEAGAHLLTCPIAGSIPAIENGSATLLVGGAEEPAETVRPVLSSFGHPERVGTREQAATLKLLNNAMLAVANAAAAELLSAAARLGVDEEQTFERLSALVPYLGVRRRGFLDRDHTDPLFQVRGVRKDLDLALAAAHQVGAALPVTAAAGELYTLAEPRHGDDELTAVIEVFSA